MLRHCQHKLAFSKSCWYTSALKNILFSREIKQTPCKQQYRSNTNVASSLQTISDDDIQTTFVAPSPVPPIAPLQMTKNEIKPGVGKVIMLEKYRRCSSIRNYDGAPCKRLVKTDPTAPITDRVLCFNHDNSNKTKQLRKTPQKKAQASPKGNIASEEIIKSLIKQYSPSILGKKKIIPPEKLYDCWDLWIGPHISEPQKSTMRQVMERPISKRDKDGFIYVYSIVDGPRVSKDTHAYFKIGRTTDPIRRMNQVANVCKLEPNIIELFPSFPLVKKQKTLLKDVEVLKASLPEIPKCPLPHRVERLIHLELSSLYRQAGFKCINCGKTHREWIRVNRRVGPNGKPMTDTELWLACIRPVILKWVQYGVAVSAINKQ